LFVFFILIRLVVLLLLFVSFAFQLVSQMHYFIRFFFTWRFSLSDGNYLQMKLGKENLLFFFVLSTLNLLLN